MAKDMMTLKQAVREVIEQNTVACKYRPSRFIQMTQGGEVEKLEEVISDLVLSPEMMDRIMADIEAHKGSPIFIEEFIAMYGFGLAPNVIREAMQRAEVILKLRSPYIK